MPDSKSLVINTGLALCPDERENLAHALLDSLAREPAEEIDEGWLAEIDQRMEAVEKETLPWFPTSSFVKRSGRRPGGNASNPPVGDSRLVSSP